jgi:osmoprotectant transport system permease protein
MEIDVDWIVRQLPSIGEYTLSHLYLSVVPILIAVLIAVPAGGLIHRTGRLRAAILGASGILYTIPSLAVFVLLPQIIGTKILDPLNVVIALVIYSTALLVRNVTDGLDAVAPETVQAAEAMGYRTLARFAFVELPIALPVILAGLRVAVVTNVSIVSVASLIGVSQLGSLFTTGAQSLFLTPVVVGIVLCLALALVLDAVVVQLERFVTPWIPRRTRTAV